ncbi:dihydrodipicolinate synthase family protein [Salipaludibacillus neizhouensis]|uniref:Dihydrodipicolinate synthase family protein n=1 Tax=Salipaludibacillus neizhouensis TaxID=885475 RepID=A0A3A9K1A8_9BACI|nr:dihydrodipicolinate synthase family protein [Salipaludibacillus neizhouensis]RKL65038.1 dihydrodipicolinate synthase family protein [Salipaludibacillus neizhouensis]
MGYAHLIQRLNTISAINLTPFYEDTKEIDWDSLEKNTNFLIDHGVKVIVPGGNTGEFYALSLDEMKKVTKKVIEIVNGRALVMVGIGYAVPTAIELGRYAQAAGADCVMIHQPIHPYSNNEGAVTYFSEIINALEIPSVIYFKNPNLSDDVLYKLAPLEKFIGVKYAINDLPRFTKIIRSISKEHQIAWICGTAETWAPYFFQAGATGFTSGLVNIHPTKSFELLQALEKKEMNKVWELWEELLPFEELRAKNNDGNNVVVIKEALRQIGFTAGVTRPPVAELDQTDKVAVAKILQGWGLINNTIV